MLGWAVLTGIHPLTTDGSADSPDSAGWRSSPGFRWRPLEISPQGRLEFQRLDPASTKILFTNTLAEVSAATNRVLLNGSGLVTGISMGTDVPTSFRPSGGVRGHRFEEIPSPLRHCPHPRAPVPEQLSGCLGIFPSVAELKNQHPVAVHTPQTVLGPSIVNYGPLSSTCSPGSCAKFTESDPKWHDSWLHPDLCLLDLVAPIHPVLDDVKPVIHHSHDLKVDDNPLV